MLRYLEEALLEAPPFAARLCRGLRHAAPFLAWRRSYPAAEVDPHFLNNYGWTEVVGPNGIVESGELACGFLLLGPETNYPHHRHEASELYVPLSGIARWQKGDEPASEFPPGAVIEHASGVSHAMLTRGRPLLALYAWRGNVRSSAQLDHFARVPG